MSLTIDRRHHHQRDTSCNDDELSCKICLSAYAQRFSSQRPRTLDCQHTFCESCLQQLVTEGRRQRKAPFGFHSGPKGQSERPADSLKCPLCKYRTWLGPSSIQGLPVNSTAMKHSSQKSGIRDDYGLQPHDLRAPCASRQVKTKGTSMIHCMSSGTTGNRVMAQRFENFHPPPQDDDIWAMLSQRRQLRFSDDDPSSFGVDDGGFGLRGGGPWDEGDGVSHDVTPSAVLVGQFGQSSESTAGQLGTLRSPSSIDCAADGRLVLVDADSVQILHSNGSYLSSFRLTGAHAACFIKDAGGGESLAVVTGSGVSICDRTGRVDKHLPIGADVLAVAALHHGGGVFVAAHGNRLTICSRYKPSAVLRSISSVRPPNAPVGHTGIPFGDIVALATTTTSRLYVVDSGTVLAVDADTATLLLSIGGSHSRPLRQPSTLTVNLAGSVLVYDSAKHCVMQFDADGGLQGCVVQLENDGTTCVALATGPPSLSSDGRQLLYILCRGSVIAEVRMYQI